ncbi:hypothetical protein A3F00_03505 [Candidatus Daviesbacteria bacterium RIFCSPHIGHO2_12_FULL_37_11]|uniref:Uncharacterized protein n=1 Tax=Candidatus Daviesbacteria bacterium RIFCSPHIGHO2_12_FULL_37_11 TaxID=1797777 RepID=A0A1F5KCT8_9BACT|nr:MAG: hypothetical protein A2111_00725 [Candidatus Daviesbacteria bacterium GWA1_38_6]OGE18020.1 MAG: hypothetical protein A2769_01135 [Candidatus Daviesbacteria bacterium RIFCSPHIGHO2_01_FULL_37_27]OGE38708.1 MAG: hypothetical protein A3F00_03505 [Candidatus Daviesbacteria bacterium RIFCSPHIGHO2_12_FULL_37_11]OGE45798.1 MAG: hypothetical protein A3B39_01045 [Candidatus Daviesbacteria bacterium RIFCSPLOWO2_01_FULL_37_10]
MLNQKGHSSIIILIIFAVIISVFYLSRQNNLANNKPQPVNSTFKSDVARENIINFPGHEKVAESDYFRGQITAPSSYYVTTDDMLTSYDSQGGMAPPRLILMKRFQVFSKYYDSINNPSNECIAIWSTNGFRSADDWNNNLTQFEGKLNNKEEFTIGTRTAEVYEVVKKGGNLFIGFLPIGNNHTTYYFNTCNPNNKSDLLSVMKSIKFRGDIKF